MFGWEAHAVIAILDVHYERTMARTGCVLIDAWPDVRPKAVHVGSAPVSREYIPGRFYLRELPCLTRLLESLERRPEVIVIDAHVWLLPGRPGLGHYLFEALKGDVVVIGVGKTAFKGSKGAVRVIRGRSCKPLYVTADGMPKDEAAACIRTMAGPHRIPLMIKMADQLARGKLNCTSDLSMAIGPATGVCGKGGQ